jgi:hypothetical protein
MFINGINGSNMVARMWSMIKTMFFTVLDVKSTVHFEFIPQSQTVNQAYYVEILKWLHEAVHRKMPEFWPSNLILHHDMLQLTRHSLLSSFWPTN